MSLRRSARNHATASTTGAADSGITAKAVVTKKRKTKSTEDIAITAIAQDGVEDGSSHDATSAMPPPPTTPAKRRKVAGSPTKPPPFTPTPSAIGLMTSNSVHRPSYSSGDIDDATPPPDRPAEPHHTNATLITPGGTQAVPSYSNFEEASPSKAATHSVTTTKCLLDEAIAHMISVDPDLKTVTDKHHCRVFSPEGLAETIDPFRSLSSGIMAQQVSGAAAKSIKNKFIGLFPAEECPTGFPPPALVAKTPLTRLREAGLSQRKAEYIQGLAEKFVNGELTIDMIMNGSDEEVMKSLVAVRGLGVWSVEMFMCFGLKRMDVFSTGDLGVQRGMAAYMGRDVGKLRNKGGKWKYMSEKEMIEIAEKFRPWRSLFMWYMCTTDQPDFITKQANKRAYSDEYWRIGGFARMLKRDLRTELQGLGWKARSSDKTEVLAKLLQKAATGRVDYSRCTKAEILKFAADRGVDLRGASKAKDIAAMLMAADDDATFPHFLDLPPELRNLVYSFYLGSLSKQLMAPARPPLAKACTLLNKEFGSALLSEKIIHLPFADLGINGGHKITTTPYTRHSLRGYLKDNTKHLRCLVVGIYRTNFRNQVVNHRSPFCAIRVQLKPSADPARGPRYFVQKLKLCPVTFADAPDRKRVLLRAMRQLLRQMGNRQINIPDIHNMSKAAERVFNHSKDEIEQSLSKTTTTT